MDGIATINGQGMPLAEAHLAVTDDGVARGDGVFETIGVWDGRPFRLDDHLRRLAASLAAVGLPPADNQTLRREAEALLTDWAGDGALRVYLTGSGTRLLTLTPPPQRVDPRHLLAQPAPWIRPLGTYQVAGAKTMSYLPNMAATRAARREGADDALLLSSEGWVLEGPTFAVLWVDSGRLWAVPPELGIVDSITRRTLLDIAAGAGIPTVVEPAQIQAVLAADEVIACSAVRDAVALRRIGQRDYPAATPLRDRLSAGLSAARRGAPAP